MQSCTEKPRLPCALKDYLSKHDTYDAFARLSARECQMAFQHWVAYGRTVSQDTPPKEQLTCPLLWCRHRFDSLEFCLQHVSTCQWLPNAWYWCHQCRRAELFIPEEHSSALPCLHSSQNKGSKLKRAVSFFKQMGRCGRSSQRHPDAGPVCRNQASPVTNSFEESNDFKKRHTNGFYRDLSTPDTSLLAAGSVPSSSQGEKKRASSHLDRPPTLYDMEANALSPLRGSHDIDVGQQAMELATSDPVFNIAQLGDSVLPELPVSSHDDDLSTMARSHPPFQYGPFSLSMCFREMEGIVSPLSSNFGHDTVSSRLMDSTIPISPLDTFFPPQWPALHDCGKDLSNDSYPRRLPQLGSRGISNNELAATSLLAQASILEPSIPWAISQTARCTQAFSAEKLVEDLHEVVCGLHSHWAEEVLEYAVFKPKFCGLSPFEAALRALQQCFRGAPPTTFEGVLSIMQLSYACGYLMNEGSYTWLALFKNVLEWQSYIQCEEHRLLYTRIVHSLWGGISATEESSSNVRRSEPGRVLALPPIPAKEMGGMEVDRHSLGGDVEGLVLGSIIPPQVFSNSGFPKDASSTIMEDGSVMRTCCDYLDSIAYANIISPSERAKSSLATTINCPQTNASVLISSILEPLLQWYGIHGFRQGVVDAQDMIRQGTLRNVREVEVTLKVVAKNSHQPLDMTKAFLNIVSAYCDSAMQDPGWRDRYYAAYVDGVLATSLEQHTMKQISVLSRRRRPAPIDTDLANNDQARLSTKQQMSGTSSGGSSADLARDSFASSATSSSYETPTIAAWSQNTSANNSNWTTPQVTPEKALFTIPPSEHTTQLPTTPHTLPANTNTSICPTCNAAFSGNLQYRTSNLRRHERTVHRRLSKLLCLEPGCGVECGRSDNLRKHMRTAHSIEEPVRRQVRGKRRRGSEVAEITNWI